MEIQKAEDLASKIASCDPRAYNIKILVAAFVRARDKATIERCKEETEKAFYNGGSLGCHSRVFAALDSILRDLD
jgi:hypothetical protein